MRRLMFRCCAALFTSTIVAASACALEPSSSCERYLACQDHHDEVLDRPPASDTNIYKPDGTCWENDDLAERCTEVCDERTEALRIRLVDREVDLGPCEGSDDSEGDEG